MTEIFERFYDKTVKIVRLNIKSGYSGDYDASVIKSIDCDLQPTSGGIYDGEKGLLMQYGMKMYFAPESDIRTGDYAFYDGESYLILRIDRRNTGCCAYLERRELYGCEA